jgi:hypothetical protein
MHLTCWDFGGQEHFQVTHQIFFSAKAVYLLVWKPRESFDPEMEARLERIQLSAGNSAKVLIVSTHADGIVPAVIGKDALRQRFGDMIWGFYEVDSAKGSIGTGIAALRQEIANAVAQLEGMDLRYPASWHAAQRAIRQITEPAVPFQQIKRVCEPHGLDADTADTLAQLLEPSTSRKPRPTPMLDRSLRRTSSSSIPNGWQKPWASSWKTGRRSHCRASCNIDDWQKSGRRTPREDVRAISQSSMVTCSG